MDRLITEYNARICGDAIYSLLPDRNGNLWIGSYRKGLTLYSDHRDIFASLSEQAGTLPYNIVAAVAAQGDNIYRYGRRRYGSLFAQRTQPLHLHFA